MKVIRIKGEEDADSVKKTARDVLLKGGLVVYPTDTVYGLGCDPLNVEAVRRVFLVKKRSFNKPLPVLIDSVETAKRIAYFTPLAQRLAKEFWPGPLTLILKNKAEIPSIVTAGTGKIGIRIPNHRVALALIGACNGMLIGTSANISGRQPPLSAMDAIRQLGSGIDLVVDCGRVPIGIPSTCIDLTVSPPRLIRGGAIPLSLIRKIVVNLYHE